MIASFKYIFKLDFKGLKNKYIEVKCRNLLTSIKKETHKKIESLKWGILATKHTLHIAKLIETRLKSYGSEVDIFIGEAKDFNLDYYFVLAPQSHKRLPPGEKRIVYQLEQSKRSKHFTQEYLTCLNTSYAVLDYSINNLEYLHTLEIKYPHTFYLPVGAHEYNNEYSSKDFDLLFYGSYKPSPRRVKLLNVLAKNFKIKIIDEIFDSEMATIIRSSKAVINLHYFDNGLLETTRINECLSYGVPVISEASIDQNNYPEFVGSVIFFKEGSEKEMIKAVNYVISKPKKYFDLKIKKSNTHSSNKFNFFMDRFLIASNFIEPYYINDIYINFLNTKNKVILSLPETTDRARYISKEAPNGFAIFSGMRLRPAWTGCGLSYKFLCLHAIKMNYPYLIVMEDDIVLPKDFDKKLKVILSYLNSKGNEWDIFSGLITEFKSKILKVETYKNINFIETDKTIGLVFSVFNKSVIKILSEWEINNDADNNTIDKYLESFKLKVYTTSPYLFGHKESLTSTLWNFQNSTYKKKISSSNYKIKKLSTRKLQIK